MRLFTTVGAAALVVGTLTAQVPQVRISQFAETKQTIGLATATVTYHRPGVKGRVIWGGLQKYGDVWRAGANEPTILTLSDAATFGGTKLAAGAYRLLVVPMEKGSWTIIVNSEVKNWGTVYDSTFDIARIPVAPVAAPHEEWMSFTFDDLTANGATIVLRWEKVALRVPLTFDTEGAFAAAAGTAESNVWRIQNNYARFVLENGGDMKKAMASADRAVALNESPVTLRTKAELLAKSGDTAGAIKTIEKAIALAKAQKMSTTFYDNLLKEWKAK